MDMQNTTHNHKAILMALEQIGKFAEYDSYYLTRDEQDSIFYRVQALKDHIDKIYGKKTGNGQ